MDDFYDGSGFNLFDGLDDDSAPYGSEGAGSYFGSVGGAGGGPDGVDRPAFSTRDGIVFLIDAGPWMYDRTVKKLAKTNTRGIKKSGDNDSDGDGDADMADSGRDEYEAPIRAALTFAGGVLQDKIITNEDHMVSIVFFGSHKQENTNDFEGVYVWQGLDVPDAQRILDVENMSERSLDSIRTELGFYGQEKIDSRAVFPFHTALWACSTLLSAAKLGYKRVFLFTNNDDPNEGLADFRLQSEKRVKDLRELGIEIHLFPLARADRSFDSDKFYRQALSQSESQDPSDPSDLMRVQNDMEKLLGDVRRKEFKKRSMLKVPFRIGPLEPTNATNASAAASAAAASAPSKGIEVALRVYCLVAPAKKGAPRWLDRATNTELTSQTKYICEDTGAVLLDSQIEYSTVFGDQQVILDRETLAQIKSIPGVSDNPGLRLLGFKPRSALKDYMNLRPSYFVYPDEQSIRGSTTFFSTLLQRMLDMEKIAIATFTPRMGSPPRLCAMLPQSHDEERMMYSGMHLIMLPFADDIRKVTVPDIRDEDRAHDADVAVAKALIRRLRLDFDSNDFENPGLQKHYNVLQALALQRKGVPDEDEMYGMRPDDHAFHSEKTIKLLKEFRERVFDPTWRAAEAKRATAVKRAKAGDGAGGKKRKVSDDDIRKAFADGTLAKLTAIELKAFLLDQGVSGVSSLKKDDVVDRVHEFLMKERKDRLKARAVAGEQLDLDDDRPPPAPAPAAAPKKKIVKPELKKKIEKSESSSDFEPKYNDDSSDDDFTPAKDQLRRDAREEEEDQYMDNPKAPMSDSSSDTDDERVAPLPMPKFKHHPSSHSQTTQSKPLDDDDEFDDPRPPCQYGMGCYRRNPGHFKEYRHPQGHATASQFESQL